MQAAVDVPVIASGGVGTLDHLVDGIVEDSSAPVVRFEPEHPDADVNGYVAYPNVDPIKEMVDMLSAARSYEANVTVVKSVRDMLRAALQIIT